MFERGDFVWAKMKSYPWWPALILNAEECGRGNNKDSKLWLFWFGDHRFSEVKKVKIENFKDSFTRNIAKSSGKLVKKAVEEILNVLASLNELQFQEPLSLLTWATSGFLSNSPISFKWKNSELPSIIQVAVSLCLKHYSDDEGNGTDNSDMDDDDVVIDVRKGLKYLEDICISCCKKDSQLISPHPLFLGSICIQCKRVITKVCKETCGQMKDICIVCGQGGNLVYCSNNLCFRSFCQICIEYLVSENAFLEIVRNDIWLCYLCKMDPSDHCLIRRRSNLQASISLLPAPEFKRPISVLSLNDIGLRVLEKANFKVKAYKINPESCTNESSEFTDYSVSYRDFSNKEIAELCADLVIGSFIAPRFLDCDRKKSAILFFQTFYRFLYRLDITRLHKLNVFFIFLAESNTLDDNILSRVMRFLMVNPVHATFGQRKFLVWNNFSQCNVYYPKKSFRNELLMDNCEVEEKILFSFMKYLQKYFEKNGE